MHLLFSYVRVYLVISVSKRYKKSLNIPKELSESVNRRTDNTMTKGRSTKHYTYNLTSINSNPTKQRG